METSSFDQEITRSGRPEAAAPLGRPAEGTNAPEARWTPSLKWVNRLLWRTASLPPEVRLQVLRYTHGLLRYIGKAEQDDPLARHLRRVLLMALWMWRIERYGGPARHLFETFDAIQDINLALVEDVGGSPSFRSRKKDPFLHLTYRARLRRATRPLHPLPARRLAAAPIAEPVADPETQLSEAQFACFAFPAVRAALAELPPRLRIVMQMRYLGDSMPPKRDVAKALGVSRELVRQREERALEMLRCRLGQTPLFSALLPHSPFLPNLGRKPQDPEPAAEAGNEEPSFPG